MKTLAIIPARGGSKGLSNKNLRYVAGHSLVGSAIECAKLCPSIDHLVVSTDSPNIAVEAETYGAPVPELRPVNLALDETPIMDVIRHEVALNPGYDVVVLLSPTTPLRLPEDVERVIRRAKHGYSCVAVVTPVEWNPHWTLVRTEHGLMSLGDDTMLSYRRQDYGDMFRLVGSVYAWDSDGLDPFWLNYPIYPIDIPNLRAIDIDVYEDLYRARAIADTIHLPWNGGIYGY